MGSAHDRVRSEEAMPVVRFGRVNVTMQLGSQKG